MTTTPGPRTDLARVRRNDQAWALSTFDGIRNHPEDQCQADIDLHAVLLLLEEAEARAEHELADGVRRALLHEARADVDGLVVRLMDAVSNDHGDCFEKGGDCHDPASVDALAALRALLAGDKAEAPE